MQRGRSLLARAFKLTNRIVAPSQGDMDMRDRVTRGVAPIRCGGVESSHRFIAPVHPRVGDSQAKCWSATEILRLFIKSDRFVEASRLAIQRRQQRLAINK